MRGKLATEGIGTFFLVLVIGLAGSAPWGPVAIASGLAALVYMGREVSGAHYNPAVTLAVLLRRRISAAAAGAYAVVQLLGGVLGIGAAAVIAGETVRIAPQPGASVAAVLLVEFLFTFVLCLVILNVALSRRTAGNGYYGLAIGAVILAGAAAGGEISGGAFNPAVGLGPVVVGLVGGGSGFDPAVFGYYVLAPVAGSVLAVGVFGVQEGGEGEG